MQVIPTRLPAIVLPMPNGLVGLVNLALVALQDLEGCLYWTGSLPDSTPYICQSVARFWDPRSSGVLSEPTSGPFR